jgi:hypothetical protein
MVQRHGLLMVVVFFVGMVMAIAGMRLWQPDAAIAQGNRSVIPEGWEFSTTTPKLIYHHPVKGAKGGRFKGTWIAENVEGIKLNSLIDTAEVQLGNEPVVYFTLNKPDADWPAGLYRLEIRAGQRLVHTERFVIR